MRASTTLKPNDYLTPGARPKRPKDIHFDPLLQPKEWGVMLGGHVKNPRQIMQEAGSLDPEIIHAHLAVANKKLDSNLADTGAQCVIIGTEQARRLRDSGFEVSSVLDGNMGTYDAAQTNPILTVVNAPMTIWHKPTINRIPFGTMQLVVMEGVTDILFSDWMIIRMGIDIYGQMETLAHTLTHEHPDHVIAGNGALKGPQVNVGTA